ncbi:glucosamine inositolphosphorylceramide transferase family protein [Acetobacter fallax]|uniref:Formyl transferase n=1 Tax=Acetobacter fallax TaxID=1737473 RepID=A0ABX0K7T1_9PROT|nr:formyl transferase [Acetobacter fallax]NHO31955.1 formyl transferase [Acetobacter fallax]NHO35529.1 formyl transferase [Acetobacter fallax]
MPFMRTDLWRCAAVHAPIGELVSAGTLEGQRITWLNDTRSFRFLADPFGIWRDGILHVFAEAYDYRDRRGRIDHLAFDSDLTLLGRGTVLNPPWHLSYPVIIEDDGEIFMLPEAWNTGTLQLYRAVSFPHHWEPVADWSFPVAAIDASPVRYGGLWWMFFSPPGNKAERQSVLCAAWAEKLTGPWHLHPGNPLRRNPASSRPGGTPVVTSAGIVLPTQDCTHTYGGALSLLTITDPTPDRFQATVTGHITAPSSCAPWRQGLHTLSGAGPITIIDAKRISLSPARHLFDARRALTHRSGKI